ncbi:MAG: energy transducer TonB [Agriterribacter sp.]
MTTLNLKRSIIPLLFSAATITFISCNENSNEGKDPDVAAIKNEPAVTPENTPPVAKKKKGTASIIINKENGQKVEKGKDGIYTNAEVMPQYPGGEQALSDFVVNKIEYPQNAIDKDAEGTVNVSFVIDEKGKVISPEAVGNKAGNGFDNEAVRIVNQMPDWKPGTVKGKPVKTRLTLPITFKLAES